MRNGAKIPQARAPQRCVQVKRNQKRSGLDFASRTCRCRLCHPSQHKPDLGTVGDFKLQTFREQRQRNVSTVCDRAEPHHTHTHETMTSTTTSSSNHTSYHTNIFTAPRTPSPHALQRPPATSFKFKLVLLGDQNTGKTCFRKRLMYDSFDNVHEPTLGIDIGVRQVETLGQDDSW